MILTWGTHRLLLFLSIVLCIFVANLWRKNFLWDKYNSLIIAYLIVITTLAN